jgi:hypothetical protein
MTLSILSLTLSMRNMIGDDKELGFLVPIGAIIWGFVCLNMLQKRYNRIDFDE